MIRGGGEEFNLVCHMELIAEIATCSRCSRQDSLTLSTSSPLTICDQSTRAMTGEIQVLVQIVSTQRLGVMVRRDM